MGWKTEERRNEDTSICILKSPPPPHLTCFHSSLLASHPCVLPSHPKGVELRREERERGRTNKKWRNRHGMSSSKFSTRRQTNMAAHSVSSKRFIHINTVYTCFGSFITVSWLVRCAQKTNIEVSPSFCSSNARRSNVRRMLLVCGCMRAFPGCSRSCISVVDGFREWEVGTIRFTSATHDRDCSF